MRAQPTGRQRELIAAEARRLGLDGGDDDFEIAMIRTARLPGLQWFVTAMLPDDRYVSGWLTKAGGTQGFAEPRRQVADPFAGL